ncbi:MAG TPA: acetate--CoA ligase family protein [Anaerolineales bacterium]
MGAGLLAAGEMDESLIPFLRPRGVVVVGVSSSPEKLGYGIARNLTQSGFAGAIHFVSPRAGELFGKPVYPDLAQVPDPADLAVLAVPAAAMADSLRRCAQRGIRAAILVSAGFREAGPEGAALEKECLEIARHNGMRLLGPNCIGTIDTHLPLDTTFLQPPMPEGGHVGFISHSGAFCAAIIDWSRLEGFDFSQIVSVGNQADVTETDMLEVVAGDDQTRVIVLYMEGVADGRRFVETAARVTRRTPVVALKVGRREGARKAAASHTGALAASDVAFEAAFARAGVLRASTAEEMFDWARALESCPLPSGRRVAVLTNAGGPGVIAADALEANGLALASLMEPTMLELASVLPSAASVQNPVDMLASASPVAYAQCLKLILGDSSVDAALVILPPPPMFTAQAVAEAILPVISASRKPVLINLMGSVLVKEARAAFDSAGVPTYPFPERAASALGALARRAQYLAGVLENPGSADSRPIPAPQPEAHTVGAEEVVARYGIRVTETQLATTPAEAVSIAEQLGYPVVLKIASADIMHKSDVGGVMVGLRTRADVLGGYAQIVQNVAAHHPSATIDGVFVQKQVPDGQEVIIGALHDPSFGPLIMFGAGGVEAEGIRDVAFALAPLTPGEAEQLMQRSWAGRRLDGFRNIPPADKQAARDALVRLSWLAYDHPEIREIEINPLRVLREGAVALDVRVVR